MTFSLLITETVRIFRERWAPLLSLSLGLMFFSALMRGIFFGEGFFHSLALPGENTALLVASVLLMLAVHILTAGAVLRVITEGDSAASPRNALAYAWGRRGDLFSLFFLNFLLGCAYSLFIIPLIIFHFFLFFFFLFPPPPPPPRGRPPPPPAPGGGGASPLFSRRSPGLSSPSTSI